MKSHTIEHPKTSHKLFKTVRQAKKVVSGKNFLSPLYSKITKREKCFNEKMQKLRSDLMLTKVIQVLTMLKI